MRKIKNENLKFQLLSLVLAFFLWIFVISDENPTLTREYNGLKIEYINSNAITDENKTLVGDMEETVDVKLQGPSSAFINLKPSDLKAEVDLKNYQVGKEEIPLVIKTPEGLRIVERSKAYVTVRVEDIESREIQVEIEKSGRPEGDVVVDKIGILPESITVEGASSLVNSVARAVAKVDVADIDLANNRNVPVDLIDSKGEPVEGLKMSQDFVNASYQVYKIVELPIKLITEGRLPDGVEELSRELSTNVVGILVKQGDDFDLTEVKTKPLNLAEITNSGDYDLVLDIDETFRLQDKNFALSVKFNIDTMTTKTIDIPIEDLERRGLGPGFRLDMPEDLKEITLEVKGLKSKISPITAEGVTAYIDLTGLGLGFHDIDIKVEKLTDKEDYSLTPDKVLVEIKGGA